MIRGQSVKASGAGTFAKGDIRNKVLLIECKAGLSRLPKTPSYGIFAKVTREAMVQKRIPIVSTAWMDCSVPDNPEAVDMRFFVPKALLDKPLKGKTPIEAIPEDKALYSHLTHWYELEKAEFVDLVEKLKWKDPPKKKASRLRKRPKGTK